MIGSSPLTHRELLASDFWAHQRGLSDLCCIIWRHFGVSHSLGRKVDRSCWNILERLPLAVHDPYERGGIDPLDAKASELSREVTECRLRDQPSAWNGRSTVLMSEATRATLVRYLDKLIELLQQIEAVADPIYNRRLRPERLLRIWREVRDALVELTVEPVAAAA